MSLLGIDVGTTGCKVAAFTEEGNLLASAYEEYEVHRPMPGYAEIPPLEVWEKVKNLIRRTAQSTQRDPVRALAISSLGEAVVPVTKDRQIIGPSLLNFDRRGEEYLERLSIELPNEKLYPINGNTLGNHFTMTKLMWVKEHLPEVYARADLFLHWGAYIGFMLGAEPRLDYALANRSLLFDVQRAAWSDELLHIADLEKHKLPPLVPSGTLIGTVADQVAKGLGLPRGVAIVSGAHDQCVNGIGCGVIQEGQAMFGMGTYIVIMPVFTQLMPAEQMIKRGLNTEHHAAPGLFVCFLYNLGGALLKWYRDTFAILDKQRAVENNRDIYADLLAEMPEKPSSVLVLPHFGPTGPPEFISDSAGFILGLKVETTRGDILKGILEGAAYYLKESFDDLSPTGIEVNEFRAAGGGSKSRAWVQLCADILNRPITRLRVTEAGALGAAILAGAGSGIFPSLQAGVDTMVKPEDTLEPRPIQNKLYNIRFEQYKLLWPMLKHYLRSLPA